MERDPDREPRLRASLWAHLLGHGLLLIALGALSVAGGGFGYLVLYAGILALLALVLGIASAGSALRARARGEAPGPSIAALLRRALRSFALALTTVLLTLFATAAVARFSSGPVGAFPGGPFEGDPITLADVDWASLTAGREEIQLQIAAPKPYTITTHFFVIEGALYVGADFVLPFKRWVHIVEERPEVVVRVGDALHARRAVRIRDPREQRRLLEIVSRQKGVEPDDWLTEVWFFRMEPAEGAP